MPEHNLEKNDLAYWYPLIKNLVPTPKTEIIETNCQLLSLLDGKKPKGYDDFLKSIIAGINKISGFPVFLRTGHTSGKHNWLKTCYLDSESKIWGHIVNLVEYSNFASISGLPLDTWVVRELLPVKPIFYAFYYMPITQEFRFFVKDGKIVHRQPYWPPEAFTKKEDNPIHWKRDLRKISVLDIDTNIILTKMTEKIGEVIGDYWSVDWLKSSKGWFMIDMAEGDVSYKWDSPYFENNILKGKSNEAKV